MSFSKYLVLGLIALLFSLAAITSAASADDFNPEGSLVVNLQESTMEEALSKTEFALVEFYAPWCGHCQKLIPTYEQLAKEVAADKELSAKVTIAKIDCDANKDVPTKFNVRGFPTIKLLKNGKEFKEYEGARTVEAFKSFLAKRTGPVATQLETVDAIPGFVAEKRSVASVIVGQFSSADSENRKKFLSAAESPKLGDFSFAEVIAKSITEEKVVVFPSYEEGSVSETKFDNLESFIAKTGYPKINVLDGETFPRIADAGLPILIAFAKFTDEKMKTQVVDLLEQVVKSKPELTDKVALTYSDGEMFGQQLKVMGGDPDNLPGIAIMHLEKKSNFPYTGALEAADLIAFVEGVVEGKIAPHLRSQPVPEKQEGAVYELVGKTFDQIVLDESKDVFVEFYAQWCGHCQKLAPIYEEVAQKLADVENLVIAKIDAAENDTPNSGVEIQGFPTLYFYPAGAKNAPIAYEGERTAEAMIDFVKNHLSAPKDAKKDEL